MTKPVVKVGDLGEWMEIQFEAPNRDEAWKIIETYEQEGWYEEHMFSQKTKRGYKFSVKLERFVVRQGRKVR